jgi:hypothetical protein
MNSQKEMKAKAREKLRAKVRHELKQKAQGEISKLLASLKAGTLDRKQLKSGLDKVRAHVRLLPNHDWHPER